ncbi:MAG: pantetheine-phosphate adenylyltransferase [Selenomonadaceae bacterium]|nr:pantetheine-phosphate adenylyltransferase [Selenomonadaceae bacterium]
MKKALCTGSFDPVTNGHVDIFERAAKLVDELVVCVFINKHKTPLFTLEERVDLLRESTLHIDNLTVDSYEGLVSDYVKQNDIDIVFRGLRSSGDFEYEYTQAQMLNHLVPNVNTVFLLTSPEFLFISSSGVRELAHFHGNIHKLVPECVEIALRAKQQNSE